MKSINTCLVVGLAAAALGVPRYARSQDVAPSHIYTYPAQQENASPQGQWDWNSEHSERQFRDFDSFMQSHPYIAKKLQENPNRVNDPGFLNGNRELKQWLDDHPMAASAFRADPDQFMARERHFQAYGQDFDAHDQRRAELAKFDWFLDSHPAIRHDLMHHPNLVDDHGYVDHHPELREFLRDHPDLSAELRDHPRDFMAREARY